MDNTTREHLSAWMDGELPADQARFLQRRLQADPALRAQWERWQLASACLRAEPVQVMPSRVAQAVAEAIAPLPAPRLSRRLPAWGAAVAAALVLALALPQWLGRDPGPPALPAAAPLAATAPDWIDVATVPVGPRSPVVAPQAVQDMPLLVTPGTAAWPRSPLAADDRALDAYVVRHEALLSEPAPWPEAADDREPPRPAPAQ